jgi:hypothetical protein
MTRPAIQLVAQGDVNIGGVQYHLDEPFSVEDAAVARWLIERGSARLASEAAPAAEQQNPGSPAQGETYGEEVTPQPVPRGAAKR